MQKFKIFCQKVATVLEILIGISLAVCLFIGALGFLGYVAAFIIGGQTAEMICEWVYKVFYAWLIKLSTITTVACFVLQYLKGDANWKNPVKYWKYKLAKNN